MARPQKQGINYFSLDTHFDASLEIVLSEFGEKGLGIIVRIWQYIYDTKGYYMPYTDDEIYMIKRICNDTTKEEIIKIISKMIEKKLFDEKLFKEGIVTSKRLQINYKTATRKRVSDGSNLPYWLLLDGSNLEETTQIKLNNIKSNNTIKYYRKFAHLKMTIEEYNKLHLKFTQEQIDDILDRIENHDKNTKYKSLYLTALTWLKREYKKNDNKEETLIVHDKYKPLNKE
jgi:hypothetical protein